MKKILLVAIALVTNVVNGIPTLQELAAQTVSTLPTTPETIEERLAQAGNTAPRTIIKSLPTGVQEAFAHQPLLKLPPQDQADFTTNSRCSMTAVAYNNEGSHIATGSQQATIFIMNAQTKQHARTLIGHSKAITSLAYSPHDHYIASGSINGTIKIWRSDTGECIHTLDGHTGTIRSLVYSPDSNRLASLSEDGMVKIWNVHAGTCLHTLSGNDPKITAIAYNPNTLLLTSGMSDGTITIWDSEATASVQTFSLPEAEYISFIAYSSDGSHLVCNSRAISILSSQTGNLLYTLTQSTERQLYNAYNPKKSHVAVALDNRTIKIWDLTTQTCLQEIVTNQSDIRSIAYSPDGLQLVSISHNDNTIKIWNTQIGSCIYTLPGHALTSCSRTRDSTKLIAIEKKENVIEIVDKQFNLLFHRLVGHEDLITVAFYSPHDKYVASGSLDETVRLWDANTGKCIRTLDHMQAIASLTFSPDGLHLASGSYGGIIKVWDIKTGTCLRTIQVNQRSVKSLAYNPDGSLLASGSTDGSLSLLNPENGECLQTIACDAKSVASILFSSDPSIISFAHFYSPVRLLNHKLIKLATIPTALRFTDYFVLKFLDRYDLPSRGTAPRLWEIIDSCSPEVSNIIELLVEGKIESPSARPLKRIKLSKES